MATDLLQPAFVPPSWAAESLGLHPDTFRRRRPLLVQAGSPEPDPLSGHYLVEDVKAWLLKRRRIASPGEGLPGHHEEEISFHAL